MLNWLKALLGRKEMDMNTIIKRLEFHEGCVLKPYYCPTGHKTIGIGHNIEARPWTDEERKAIGANPRDGQLFHGYDAHYVLPYEIGTVQLRPQ